MTASESNNQYFVIESSIDTENWNEVGVLSAAVNSSSTMSYSIINTNPFSGISYYRLKQVDFNNEFEYLGIRSVTYFL